MFHFSAGTFLKRTASTSLKSFLLINIFTAVEIGLFIVVTTTSMNSFGLNDLILAAATNSAYQETSGFRTKVKDRSGSWDG